MPFDTQSEPALFTCVVFFAWIKRKSWSKRGSLCSQLGENLTSYQKKKVTFLKAVLHEALMSIEKLVFVPFSQSSMYESVILNDWHKTWCLPLMFLKPCKLLCDCTGTNISTWRHSVNRALKDSKRFMANRNILMLKCWRVVQEWWRGLFFFILYDVTMTFLVPRQGIFLLCNRPNERCSTYQ